MPRLHRERVVFLSDGLLFSCHFGFLPYAPPFCGHFSLPRGCSGTRRFYFAQARTSDTRFSLCVWEPGSARKFYLHGTFHRHGFGSLPGCPAQRVTFARCRSRPARPGTSVQRVTFTRCRSRPARPGTSARRVTFTRCRSRPALPGTSALRWVWEARALTFPHRFADAFPRLTYAPRRRAATGHTLLAYILPCFWQKARKKTIFFAIFPKMLATAARVCYTQKKREYPAKRR